MAAVGRDTVDPVGGGQEDLGEGAEGGERAAGVGEGRMCDGAGAAAAAPQRAQRCCVVAQRGEGMRGREALARRLQIAGALLVILR